MFNRPVLHIPKSKLEVVHDALAIVILLGIMAYTAFVWAALPDQFPTHFDSSGKPNGWGGRGNLLLLPILSVFIYAGLTLLRKVPHKFNYLREITEANAQRQYVIAIQMLSWMKVLIVALFGFVEWNIIQAAYGYEPQAWLLVISVLIFLAVIFFHIIRSLKAN
ncbi:DUF1648 domain-containing protein [Paenibacillus sp. SYP-B3998]|uniref:DUF1648 domain-containing protein n=1 Tax=Paenibacillus sp. SYP-B3998 TaxID=2678564 RepID=A0A6G4A219_9BACL|nr:DUF1648 domain-containing protein [Paenibacillus sp. SYP-B3998]NEW08536.1 DUF1648 domain-containing protein [Paenibacillus sp. SYP-B3998]